MLFNAIGEKRIKLAGVNYREWRGKGKTPFKLIFGKSITDSANLSSQIKGTICPMQFPALNGKSMDFNAAQFSCESLNCLGNLIKLSSREIRLYLVVSTRIEGSIIQNVDRLFACIHYEQTNQTMQASNV